MKKHSATYVLGVRGLVQVAEEQVGLHGVPHDVEEGTVAAEHGGVLLDLAQRVLEQWLFVSRGQTRRVAVSSSEPLDAALTDGQQHLSTDQELS